jgi:poly-gamma-glutamate capsule biosynthesis protein CapA/YwtB (metallophosphatase superfamily)
MNSLFIYFCSMGTKNVIFFFFLLISNELWSQKTEVKLLFMGDIMGHGPQIEAAYDAKTKTYDYQNCFVYIKDILSEPDFTIGNLEVTLGSKPYSGYPMFSSPPELALAVKNAGVDILGTANNHSCDRKEKGIKRTIDLLDSLKISHFGTYKNQDHKSKSGLMLLDRNGIKIGLLNYTYGTNGISISDSSMVSFLNKKNILTDIALAKKSNPDVLIAYVHWGAEYKDLPIQDQKNWFAFFKENGVSIVIGSHPHVVEPMEWDKKAETLVVYSLGNFISNQRFFPSDGGAVFELTLSKNSQNKVEISQAQYVLTWVYKRVLNGKTDYLVLPVDEFQYKKYFFHQAQDFEQMMKFTRHVRKLLEAHNLNVTEKKVFTRDVEKLMREVYVRLY